MADDLDKLLESTMEAVKRDLKHIHQEVVNRKLSHSSSKDLIQYVKILSEASEQRKKDAEKAKGSLGKMTDEELSELARSLINETSNRSPIK